MFCLLFVPTPNRRLVLKLHYIALQKHAGLLDRLNQLLPIRGTPFNLKVVIIQFVLFLQS